MHATAHCRSIRGFLQVRDAPPITFPDSAETNCHPRIAYHEPGKNCRVETTANQGGTQASPIATR